MPDSLETYQWDEVGYKPLVFTPGWQVALLNWEPIFDRANVTQVERHNHTDEVFVMVQGQAVLFTCHDGEALQVVELVRGAVYNVPKTVWHNVVATRDVIFIIVEDRDTHLHDVEYRPIAPEELAALDAQLPAWAVK